MICSAQPIEKHLTICEKDQTIIAALSGLCPELSKQKLKLAMQYGAVWLTPANNIAKAVRTRRAKKRLSIGDQLHLYYNENNLFSEIPPARLVADEGEYSIWDKPCGMFSQGTKWGDHSSIARWVELFGLQQSQREQRSTFLVHRLDRATNGLIMVAHTKKATKQLTQLFEARKIDKYYSAIVNGQYLAETKSNELNDDIDGKPAKTIILSSNYHSKTNQTSLNIKIVSGRKHQIRKHLSGIGFPIVGDRLYGNVSKNDNELPDLMLRSYSIEFKCPLSQINRCYHLHPY